MRTLLVAVAALCSTTPAFAGSPRAMLGINVVLNTNVTDAILKDLGTHGAVRDVIPEIRGITMQARASELSTIQALSYVASAGPDAVRNGAPIDTVAATDFTNGISTWNLDAINVTNFGAGRTVAYDGTGVYVAVIDTGLVDSWRQYFPQERVAEQFGIAFGGGGGEVGSVSSQPEKWQHDQNSHGTHVTSTILGFNRGTYTVNGVAPMATVIPVKVLNQNGSGWSSVVARGITYVADLKKNGGLGNHPVVINMSLGGPTLDSMEQAAIDYAVANGVLVVASAGNEGESGMGYPGAYAPVISVAAAGWTGEWTSATWWRADVADPTSASDFYITDFSSRELAEPDQDLDVAAPGSWIVGPYQTNSGQISYYYLGGTSMASPHVAGVVALMLQKNAALTQAQAEEILETTALALPAGCRDIVDPSAGPIEVCWETDASGAGLVDAAAALAAVE